MNGPEETGRLESFEDWISSIPSCDDCGLPLSISGPETGCRTCLARHVLEEDHSLSVSP